MGVEGNSPLKLFHVSILIVASVIRMAGSYEALEAGNTGDALVDFTGGVCESIDLKNGGYIEDLDKRMTLFKSMERAMREKSLISASIRVSGKLIPCSYITLDENVLIIKFSKCVVQGSCGVLKSLKKSYF